MGPLSGLSREHLEAIYADLEIFLERVASLVEDPTWPPLRAGLDWSPPPPGARMSHRASWSIRLTVTTKVSSVVT
jgi:hypothetical protein